MISRRKVKFPDIPIICSSVLLFGVVILLVLPVFWTMETSAYDNSNKPFVPGEEEGEGYYMFEKESFTYIHLEGNPKQIGKLHGEHLSDKVERSISAYAHLTEERYDFNWRECRLQAANFWSYVPSAQRQEIEGIAEGASSQGVKNPMGDTVDWLDILTLNCMWDLWWRADGVGARLPSPLGRSKGNIHHCSAFVATGSATADGKFVIAQNLWMPFYLSPAHAVFMDIVPQDGNRILMEVTAGMIWSGTEWYMNGAGLVIAETTLGEGPYNWGKVPSFVRLRKAVQYADSIDEFKTIMLTNTNGAYCGDYLLADTKTNEVAILELGSEKWVLERTMDGFLGSCNYPWDPEVAEEMNAAQGWEHGCYPRYVRLDQLYQEHKGNITIETGKEILSDHYDTVEEKINPCGHTLCGHVENASGYPWGSLDGKVTNQTLAARFETWARFGHSCGQAFKVEDLRKEHPEYCFDDLWDVIPGEWCTFGPVEPVEVAVEDRNGNPVRGAEVQLCSKLDGWKLNGTTDENGIIQFPWVMHSKYYINGTDGTLEGSLLAPVDGPEKFTLTLLKTANEGDDGVFGFAELVWAFVILGGVAAILLVLMNRNKS